MRRRRPGLLTGLFITGGLLIVVGIYFAAGLSASTSLCNSGLGGLAQGVSSQAQSSCALANALYAAGIVAVILGVVCIAGAVVHLVTTEPLPRRGAKAAPGWYKVPGVEGTSAYWDGARWHPDTRRPTSS